MLRKCGEVFVTPKKDNRDLHCSTGVIVGHEDGPCCACDPGGIGSPMLSSPFQRSCPDDSGHREHVSHASGQSHREANDPSRPEARSQPRSRNGEQCKTRPLARAASWIRGALNCPRIPRYRRQSRAHYRSVSWEPVVSKWGIFECDGSPQMLADDLCKR